MLPTIGFGLSRKQLAWPPHNLATQPWMTLTAHIPHHVIIMDWNSLTGPFLVVGGCGCLGHHIVNEIFANGPRNPNVAIIDLKTDHNRHSSATYHNADITRRDEVAKVFDDVKPQVVFHTVSPHPLEADQPTLEKVNVIGTQNLIECAKAVSTVRAFVYTSSSSLVHNQREPMVEATEDLPVLFYPEQPEYYSHTKALAEKIVLSANRENGMLTGSVRPATLYGAGDGILTVHLANTALSGRAKYRFGSGDYLYDTTYVENCVHAQMLLAQALVKAAASAPLPADVKVEGEAFNVTNDEHIPFWDQQLLVAEVAGLPVRKEDIKCLPIWLMMTIAYLSEWAYWIFSLGQKKPRMTRRIVRITTSERTVSIDKVKERLGYKPRFTNREGWVKAVEWALPHVKASKEKKVA